ncbi:hypothetical protein PPACK8108_LOCUS16687 [Phakopsora pachyrhizi]|uniref:Uncharacterized protein n=1 Tax=Phakopsora pachyrhizi TaxID=170000 RepID=A0AAV0BBV0_PHAPC|nr:hypothetical protein PPACK8108_LOCUS16687 [Phakopsora pachyrhizi]
MTRFFISTNSCQELDWNIILVERRQDNWRRQSDQMEINWKMSEAGSENSQKTLPAKEA